MFMATSLAKSTRKNYTLAAMAFSKWCLHNGLTIGNQLPVPSVRTLVYHCAWRAGQGNSPGYIRSCLSGVAAYFEWHHHPNILRDRHGNIHQDIARVMRGISRLLSTKRKKRLPITVPLLNKMLAIMAVACPHLSTHDRYAYQCALSNGTYGFLRASEETAPTTDEWDMDSTALGTDLKLKGSFYSFNIKTSKTDKLRTGQVIEIHATDESWCPVALARRWMAVRRAPQSKPLFTLENGSFITRTRLSSVMRACIKHLGLPEADYCSHSMRGGAAVTLAAAGYAHLVPIAGRWSTTGSAYHAYLEHISRATYAAMHRAMARVKDADILGSHSKVYADRFSF